MKLLYIHRTQGRGVERVHIDGVCKGLAKRGFEVTEIAPTPKSSTTQGIQGLNGQTKQTLISKISRLAPEWIFELLEMTYNLVGILKALRSGIEPDLIYERYALFSFVGVFVSWLKGCPLVIECNYTALNPLFRQRTKLFLPLARFIDRFILSRADILVCVSSTIKNQINTQYGINGTHIIVQPNASDIYPDCALTPTKIEGLAPDHKVVGFVGGFYPWHGLELLVMAFLRTLPVEPDIRLLLIGEGPERSKIELLLRSHGAATKAFFVGSVPHHELQGYLKLFDVGVMPDSNDYGSPMKIFEYMALGVPVVAPDYPPIVEVFDGQGICFSKQSVSSLADALTTLLTNEELRRKQGKRGVKLIQQRHNWQANVDQTLKALDSQGYSFNVSNIKLS